MRAHVASSATASHVPLRTPSVLDTNAAMVGASSLRCARADTTAVRPVLPSSTHSDWSCSPRHSRAQAHLSLLVATLHLQFLLSPVHPLPSVAPPDSAFLPHAPHAFFSSPSPPPRAHPSAHEWSRNLRVLPVPPALQVSACVSLLPSSGPPRSSFCAFATDGRVEDPQTSERTYLSFVQTGLSRPALLRLDIASTQNIVNWLSHAASLAVTMNIAAFSTSEVWHTAHKAASISSISWLAASANC